MEIRSEDSECCEAHLALYTQVVVHTHIGDEATYGKFLYKNQYSDSVCRQKIEAINYVENRLKNIVSQYKTCLRNGHERAYNMCQKITQEPSCFFHKELRWKTCELSGHLSNSCVRIEWNDTHMYIDERFHSFVICLWLVTHIQNIEINRVDMYIQTTDAVETISETITGFNNSKYVITDDDIATYRHAFELVEQTLDATCLATSSGRLIPNVLDETARAD